MVSANKNQHALVNSIKEIIQSAAMRKCSIYKVEKSAKLMVKIKGK